MSHFLGIVCERLPPERSSRRSASNLISFVRFGQYNWEDPTAVATSHRIAAGCHLPSRFRASSRFAAVIPLVLLAGFLGAGKTRFLTALIPELHARNVRVRVILNDFENADIDASRLAALDALVTPLNGECVCCTSLKELIDLLVAVPPDPGSVMLIEANGATETDELIGHLTTDVRLAQFTWPLQLTVIDAGRWQKRWWHNKLEVAQTTTATHAHLNWTETLKAARISEVTTSVRRVNEALTLTTPAHFAVTLEALVEDVRDVRSRSAMRPFAHRDSDRDSDAHSHVHTNKPTHLHPFASASVPLPAVVDRDAFEAFVRALPDAVVRAKGQVFFRGREGTMFVWSKVDGRRGVQYDEVPAFGTPTPVALFIGAALPVDDIERMVAALRTST
jgi:G3E family GTPase